jgi:AraC-like DNA-binding protein
MSIEPLVRANVLTGFPEYAAAHGLDFFSLLNDVGLRVDEVKDPETLVSLNRIGELFDIVASRIGDPAFGIRYAEQFPQGATGLLGNLVLSAPTVRTALAVAAQYLAVQTIPVDASFVEEASGVGYLRWKFSVGFHKPRVQFTAFTAAAFLLRMRLATDPKPWFPLAVNFDHAPPEATKAYRDFFGPRLRFNHVDNGMAIDPTTLNMRMPQKRLEVFEQLRRLGSFELKDMKRNGAAQSKPEDMSTPARVRIEIKRRLDGSAGLGFDQPAIAQALGLTVRALQSELAAEQTSYEKILVEMREMLADEFLRERDLTLSQISLKLGFSEASAFTRWARRTYGQSPSAQRQLLQSGVLPQTDAPAAGDEPGDDS